LIGQRHWPDQSGYFAASYFAVSDFTASIFAVSWAFPAAVQANEAMMAAAMIRLSRMSISPLQTGVRKVPPAFFFYLWLRIHRRRRVTEVESRRPRRPRAKRRAAALLAAIDAAGSGLL
jgi:hypothetical protein